MLEVQPCRVEVELGGGVRVMAFGVTRGMVGLEVDLGEQIIYLINLPDDMPLVLGRKWLREYNPSTDWRAYEIYETSGNRRKASVMPWHAPQHRQITLKLISI